MLTQAQLTTLKTYINGVPEWAALPNGSEEAVTIAAALNADAAPDFIVWRNDVAANEIGEAWIGTDIDGMTALNMQRLQLMLASSAGSTFDMRRADRRAGFENPFGTNQNNASRVAMRTSWKRKARLIEKILATGTGSDASPAVMTHIGQIGWPDVQAARSI